MFDSFFQAICRVGIFMICAQAIVHFRPQEAYEKYLKLLVSIMVLIQLFLPLGGFLLGGGGKETESALEQFKQELEQSMKDAEESVAEADALLEKMTLKEVQGRMKEQEEAQKDAEENRDERESGANAAEEIEIEIEAVDPVTIGKEKPDGVNDE